MQQQKTKHENRHVVIRKGNDFGNLVLCIDCVRNATASFVPGSDRPQLMAILRNTGPGSPRVQLRDPQRPKTRLDHHPRRPAELRNLSVRSSFDRQNILLIYSGQRIFLHAGTKDFFR
jgi:hypothetical protein